MIKPLQPTSHPKSTAGVHSDTRVKLPREEITGVILAGGKGRRMGGEDKGLLELDGTPLVKRITELLQPQVGSLMINANRNLERYRVFGFSVIRDSLGDYFGPLAGIASALQVLETPYLLTVPCDSPLLPSDLAARLYHALHRADAEISIAHDGSRRQLVFALLRRELLPDLLTYLNNGGRKLGSWYGEHRLVEADFSDYTEAFLNLNTPKEWSRLEKRITAN